VYLVYMDDSGDPGVHPGSPTPAFTVSCVLVRDAHWTSLFEDMIRFRRYLRANFGLRMRQEVKANELAKVALTELRHPGPEALGEARRRASPSFRSI
jgi:hypothetical protein